MIGIIFGPILAGIILIGNGGGNGGGQRPEPAGPPDVNVDITSASIKSTTVQAGKTVMMTVTAMSDKRPIHAYICAIFREPAGGNFGSCGEDVIVRRKTELLFDISVDIPPDATLATYSGSIQVFSRNGDLLGLEENVANVTVTAP